MDLNERPKLLRQFLALLSACALLLFGFAQNVHAATDRPLVIFEASGVIGEEAVPDVVRIGDRLVLKGHGFAEDASEILVLFESIGEPVSVTPLSVVNEDSAAAGHPTTQLDVNVPKGATGAVSVQQGDRRSNAIQMEILAADRPVLFDVGEAEAVVGRPFDFRGAGLFGETKVALRGVTLTVQGAADGSRLTLTIPEASQSGPVTVETAAGPSNTVFVTVDSPVIGRVRLPSKMTDVEVGTLDVTQGFSHVARVNHDGSFESQYGSTFGGSISTFLPATMRRPYTPFFQAFAVPGDTELELTAQSTAVAEVMRGLLISHKVDRKDLAAARDLIASLPTVQAYGQALELRFIDEPYFRRYGDDPDLVPMLEAASAAADAAINTALYAKELAPFRTQAQ